jgi:hypothetical protein
MNTKQSPPPLTCARTSVTCANTHSSAHTSARVSEAALPITNTRRLGDVEEVVGGKVEERCEDRVLVAEEAGSRDEAGPK